MAHKPFYTLSHRDINENLSGVNNFEKPEIVDILAQDNVYKLAPLERMKYFRFPERSRFPLDLKEGIDRYVYHDVDKHTHMDGKLSKIAYYIMQRNELKIADDDEVLQHEIITSRSVLLDLMMAPYLSKQQWKNLIVTRFKNKLFIRREKWPYEHRSPRSTYHFKLLQHCLTDDPKQESDTSKPVDENVQLHGIFKSTLKNLRFLYSGVIVGIISDEKLGNKHDWNEINQKKHVLIKISQRMNPNKMFSFWCKSYLSAVNDLYIGHFNNSGFVFDLEHKIVSDLPNENYWDPKVCTAFVYKFLSLVLEEMKDVNCPYTTYVFSKDSGCKTIYLDIHEGKTEHSFLTEDFIEHLKKKK